MPFVLFRKPNEEMIQLIVNDNSEENIFLIHSFDNETEKSISDKNPIQIHQDEFNFEFKLNLESGENFNPISEENYVELIQKTIDEIQTSETNKIVISRIKQIDNQCFNLFRSFKNLLETHPGALVYMWHNPGNETWIAATPELLLSKNENIVKTVSLAGTKLSETGWTSKEFNEQQIVTDYILENFSEMNEVELKGPETIQAGKFQHLKSYISGKIHSEFSLEDLLEKMHPTPAVCGLPKEKAFEFIVENEGYDRNFYAGYIGIETESSQEYFVNLRCAQFYQNKIWIYVGGGITAESNPQNEWNETELKSGTILNSLLK
ncbi:isochorismate synthase [Moheibacter sediminis]|uniref:isochorismate synthase n=2 Tax=Moheibacter sediminis TaxID=1434700 RepID=A0A1W2ACH7_9FLAO|nr:isochorismate synthase [Moheibacter sediminis]